MIWLWTNSASAPFYSLEQVTAEINSRTAVKYCNRNSAACCWTQTIHGMPASVLLWQSGAWELANRIIWREQTPSSEMSTTRHFNYAFSLPKKQKNCTGTSTVLYFSLVEYNCDNAPRLKICVEYDTKLALELEQKVVYHRCRRSRRFVSRWVASCK